MHAVFIFHGVGGTPEENWFPWLKSELEKQGMKVVVPAFPNPSQPEFDTWLKHFEHYDVDSSAIFVGHSLGGAFALRLLEQMKHPIKATYLVASVSGIMDNEFDPLMTTFNTAPYDWKVIKKNAGDIHVLHSDNDQYIALAKAQSLAENLGVHVELTKGAGHFNQSSGYFQFPALRDSILKIGEQTSLTQRRE